MASDDVVASDDAVASDDVVTSDDEIILGKAGFTLLLDEGNICGTEDVIEATLLLAGLEDGESGETETDGAVLATGVTGDDGAGHG